MSRATGWCEDWRGGMDHFRRIDAREVCGLPVDGPLVNWTRLAEPRPGRPGHKGNKGWMAQPLALSQKPWIPEPDSRHWGRVK